MAVFRYVAFQPQTGTTVKGSGEFRDVRELFIALRAEGQILLSYRLTRRSFRERYGRVSRPEIAEFCRNVAFLLSAGVPLFQGLDDVRKVTDNVVLERSIGRVISHLREGLSFSAALEREPRVFPAVVRSLAAIGEETGRLDETMGDAASHLMRVQEIVAQSKRAMWYPSFVIVSVGGALAVWFFYVLPKIFAVFQEMKIRLPLATRMLMAVVAFLKSYWFLGAVPFLVVAVTAIGVRRSQTVALFVERLSLHIPLLKRAKRLSMTAFFFEYLGLLLDAGIDILTALRVMEESITSQLMKRLIAPLGDSIRAGNPFSRACEERRFFHPMELRIIKVGEESGKLVEQLKILGESSYKKLMEFVEALPKVLEPALIIVVGLVFLIIVLAFLGPVYELISVVGRSY